MWDRALSSFLNESPLYSLSRKFIKATDMFNGSTHLHNAFINYCIGTTGLALHSEISVGPSIL